MCIFLGGALFDRLKPRLLLSGTLFGLGVLQAVVPWTRSLGVIIAVLAISGMFAGALDTGKY